MEDESNSTREEPPFKGLRVYFERSRSAHAATALALREQNHIFSIFIHHFLKWFQNPRSGSRARRRPIEKAQHTYSM
jgi:phosphatidylserine/phosphatidylglycerophosphate/cardiolipin synthase-like enzyme